MRCSPKACSGQSCSERWPAVRSCGGDGSVFVGRGVAEALRAPGHRGSTCGGPAKALGGLVESGDHRRRRIAGAEWDTGGGPRLDSRTTGLRVEGERLEELLGGAAKLLRASAGAGMHRSGRPTTEQRRCTAEQAGGGARASVAAVAARVGDRGSWGSYL
jgi:hypothetical protein